MASLLLTTAPGAMLPGMPVVSPGGAAPTVDFLDLLMPSADVAPAIPGGTRQDVAAMPGTTLPTMPAAAAAAPAGEDALAWLENATGVVVPPAPPVVASPVAIEAPAPVAVPVTRAPAQLLAPPIVEPVMVPDDLVPTDLPVTPDNDTTTPTDDDDAAPKDAASETPATLVSAQPQLAAAPPPVDVPVAPRHAKAEAHGKAASVATKTDAVTTAPAASQPVAPAPLAAVPQPAAEAAPVTVTPPVAHDAAPGARAASRRSATIAPTPDVTAAAGPAPEPVVTTVTTPVVASPDVALMPAPEPSARAVPTPTTATVPTDAPAVMVSAPATPPEAQPAPVAARTRTGVRPDASTRQPVAVDQVVTANGDTPVAAASPRAASRRPVVIDRAGAQAIAADAQFAPTPADPTRPVIAAAAPLRVDTAMPLDVAPVRADVAVPLAAAPTRADVAAPLTATPVRAGATIPSVAVPARADAVAPPTAKPARAGAAIPPAAAPVRTDTVAPLTATLVRGDAAIPLATPSPSAVPAVPLAAIPIVTPVTPVGVAPAATPSPVETPVATTPTADEAPPRTAAVATPAPAPAPSAPVIASAARTFADAIHRAVTGEERGRAADPTGGAPATAPVDTITAAAVAAPAQAGQQTLDMRQPHWPETMIQRIEMLRDMADANDMRIRVVPDALGAIDVSLRRDGDTVQVQLTAEQPQTRAMLAEAQPRLTDMAEARGLKLTQAGGGTGASGQNADRQPSSQQQRPAPVPAAPPSARRPAEVADDTDQLIA